MPVCDPEVEEEQEEKDEVTDQNNEVELDTEEARRYLATTARLNYFAVDRVDVQYAVKEAARHMSTPRTSSWKILNKMGGYLVGRPWLVMRFEWQSPTEMVTSFTDSDWAGCPKTGKSTSGGIVGIGKHVIKSYSRQQPVIASSSAEAELYAMVATSAEALAIVAYAKDLGTNMTGKVYVDSSAALDTFGHKGYGCRRRASQGA